MLNQALLLSTFLWALTTVSQLCKPWGVRLYLGDSYMHPLSPIDLRIVFNTDNACPSSYLILQNNKIPCRSQNTTIVPINYTIHTHTCEIKIGQEQWKGDVFKGKYTAVGVTATGEEIKREEIEMRVPKRDIKGEFDVLVLGDWGQLDDQAIGTVDDIMPHVTKVVANQRTMAALFMGDLAYDLCDQEIVSSISCAKYKPMMIAAEPITTKIAFMPILGNHQYSSKHILSKQLVDETYMLPSGNIEQYSFEIGDIRFQGFNPYDEIFLNDFKNTDEKIANLTVDNKSRGENVNWVIPFSHYPVYCKSYINNAECVNDAYNIQMGRFLDYFHEAGVQVYIGAHIHQYRRTKPMNRSGQLGTFTQTKSKNGVTYTSLNDSIIYIIQGAAGNSNFMQLDGFKLAQYQASQIPNSGYMVISSSSDKILKVTHYFGKNGSVADQFIVWNAKEDQWKVAVILSLSQLLFVVVMAVMVWMVCRHRPVRQHSEMMENLVTKTEVEV